MMMMMNTKYCVLYFSRKNHDKIMVRRYILITANMQRHFTISGLVAVVSKRVIGWLTAAV
jgi:hypothetical protein